MKRLTIVVLDTVDRLAEIQSWFGTFETFSVSVQLWVRDEEVPAARFLAPSATVFALDRRLWTTEGLRSWWSQAFAPAFDFDPDEIIIVEKDLTQAFERLLLLFPTRRITAWLVAHPYRDDDPDAGEIDGLRVVLRGREALRRRLGVQDSDGGWPWFDSPELTEDGTQFWLDSGLGTGAFLVADVGTSLAGIDLSATQIAGISSTGQEGIGARDPRKRIALIHDADLSPAPLVESMESRGFVVLPVSRGDVGLRVRASLVYLSWGFIGFPHSADFYFANLLKRPILAFCGGSGWESRRPPLHSGLWIDCTAAESVSTRGVAYRITPDFIAGAFSYLLDVGASRGLPLDPSALGQAVRRASRDRLRELDHQRFGHGRNAGRQAMLDQFPGALSGVDAAGSDAASHLQQALAALE